MHSLNPRRHAASIVGIVLLLGLALLPWLAGPYTVFVAAQLITATYLALAVDLGHSMGRVLSFCSGSFFALGAYAMFYVARSVSGELLLALPVVVALVMVCGVLVALMVTRMRGAHAAVVATLAIGSVLALLADALSDITGGEDGLTFRAPLTLAGLPIATGVNGATYALALLPLAALAAGLYGVVHDAIRYGDARGG
jgi:branched-chain amino acid transport system permease protein